MASFQQNKTKLTMKMDKESNFVWRRMSSIKLRNRKSNASDSYSTTESRKRLDNHRLPLFATVEGQKSETSNSPFLTQKNIIRQSINLSSHLFLPTYIFPSPSKARLYLKQRAFKVKEHCSKDL